MPFHRLGLTWSASSSVPGAEIIQKVKQAREKHAKLLRKKLSIIKDFNLLHREWKVAGISKLWKVLLD